MFYPRYGDFKSTHEFFSVWEIPRESQLHQRGPSDQKVTKEGSAGLRVGTFSVTMPTRAVHPQTDRHASSLPGILLAAVRGPKKGSTHDLVPAPREQTHGKKLHQSVSISPGCLFGVSFPDQFSTVQLTSFRIPGISAVADGSQNLLII